jgi:hypothetical protein
MTQYQTPLSGSLTFTIDPRLTLSNSDWEGRWCFSVLLSFIHQGVSLVDFCETGELMIFASK